MLFGIMFMAMLFGIMFMAMLFGIMFIAMLAGMFIAMLAGMFIPMFAGMFIAMFVGIIFMPTLPPMPPVKEKEFLISANSTSVHCILVFLFVC